jgi:C-terminal processing protease CtpA/Prc
VSFLANGQTGRTIAWAPDGKFLIFDTAQRSEDAKMVRVDLLPNVPKHREDVFRELFTPGQTPDQPSPATTPDTQTSQPAQPAEPAEPATRRPDPEAVLAAASTPAKPKGKTPPSPVRIVFEGIRERASILPLGLNAQDPVISPDGKTLVFRASTAGQDNLFSYSLDELSKEPPVPGQLTSTKKPKRDWGFTPDGKSVFFLEGGVVTTTPIESPKTKPVPVTAEMDVDFDQEKMVVFDQAWGGLNRRFYDPNFHGADWAAIRTRWAPRIQAARTSDEMRRLLNLMVGELNASHLGVNSPPTPGGPTPRTGDLGLRFDREAYEAGRGLVVREVVALGPAFLEGSIRPGDTLVSVNGRAIERDTNLDFLLQHEVGKRVVLGVRPAGGTRVREAVVRPVGAAVAAGLLYRQWVNERRAYVDRISGGRLGYVHVADMGDASLDQLYIDLDAENQGKQGVVLDLRHNNGGYVNGRVLDVFTRQNFLMMTPRDLFAVPSRQSLGQRALGAPTVLVVNESSLSDAEDFTEGYRTLGVGKVVGVPTAGWIIYTSNQPMIDGSIVRLPQTRVEDLRGQNMELNPRPVDIRVERPLGETLTGRDAQLDAAVASLLSTVQGSQGGPAAPAAR